MAKAKLTKAERASQYSPKGAKRTSIGQSPNSRPKGKNKRAQHKKYRGQG